MKSLWKYFGGIIKRVKTESTYRSREDVESTLAYAKLESSDMRSLAQCLQLSPYLDNDSIKLIELENNVLDSLLDGKSLIIRGSETDGAVLCTTNETFELKEAETSNSLLILPECSITKEELDAVNEPSSVCRQISALKHNYFELRRIKPRIKRLKELLEESTYAGDRCDWEKSGQKYTLRQLLESVQASEGELLQGLRKLNACLIDGFWRLLDFDYLCAILNSILAVKDEMSWSNDSILWDPLNSMLQDIYPSQILRHVLQLFAEAVADDSLCYKLNEDLICKFFAEMLLHAAHRYNLSEFEEAWQLAVPDGMKTSLRQLEGLALIDRSSTPEIICHFPVDELPEEVGVRFQTLFRTKEKWRLEELTPYLEDLCIDGKIGVSSLLTKFARVSTQKGIKLYSSRK